MSDFIRATLNFPFVTGLPRDVAVLDFAFTADGSDPDHYEVIFNALLTYADEVLAPYLSKYIDGDAVFVEMAVTDSVTGHQTSPFTDRRSAPIDITHGDESLPLEVAVCASQFAPGGSTAGRRKGRHYVGPLSVLVVDGGSTTAWRPTVRDSFITEVNDGCQAIAGAADAGGFNWGVWSRADGVVNPISGGWIDDEFDTQRRRGLEPTARATWGAI